MDSLVQSVVQVQWPKVSAFFPYIDYAVAKCILGDVEEPIAALLAYLSLAAREGHLCVKIDADAIYPELTQIAEDNQEITSLIIQGASVLTDKWVCDVSLHQLTDSPITPICRSGRLYYLQRCWKQESSILKHFQKSASSAPGIILSNETVENNLKDLEAENKLLKEQADAIRLACSQAVTLIAGGPGTGKTYTAGELIKIYWKSMNDVDRLHCKIVLAAPTGKAAANLQKSLSRAMANIDDFPGIHAKTIHSLLGIKNSGKRSDAEPINADLILIDESSMIDASLMEELLKSVKNGARLVLLGDRHQLPPVGAGMLFSDLIQSCSKYSIELKRCLRAELQTIIHLASSINKGDYASADDVLSSECSGISRIEWGSNSIKAMHQAILERALPFFLESSKIEPESYLNTFSRFCILCPLRQGPYGVDALNELFFRHILFSTKNDETIAIPILLLANDARLELSNGEIGILVKRIDKKHEGQLQVGDYALFYCHDGKNSIRKIPALALPKFEYAFCLSVHKSQGSEFDRVLLLMPEGSERFGREVLYTAVTRARKHIEIWGSDAVIKSAIEMKANRLSGMPERLTKI